MLCSDLGRVLVLNDPPERSGTASAGVEAAAKQANPANDLMIAAFFMVGRLRLTVSNPH